MSQPPPAPPPWRTGLGRTALRLIALVLVGYGAHLLMGLASDAVDRLPAHVQGPATLALTLGMLLLYALLIALPFVPGIEIGVTLMMLRGAEIAPAVYLGTISGLMLAYMAGRFQPYAVLRRVFLDLRLLRACALLDDIEPLSRPRRLALLRARLPGRLGDLAVRFRYVSIAVLINVPGNAVIGGGGGICLIAGLSHLFSRRGMILTIAIAVAPVPLAVWLYGTGLLGGH